VPLKLHIKLVFKQAAAWCKYNIAGGGSVKHLGINPGREYFFTRLPEQKVPEATSETL
jgi:hypothetical protein